MITHVYIDASNLFYGGKKSLGWSIDYAKLYKYLQFKFGVSEIYYFGGVEIYGFPYDSVTTDKVSLDELEKYLVKYIERKAYCISSGKVNIYNKNINQIHFYKRLEKIGYNLFLKPVKIYTDEDGNKRRKANCDVEMAFYLTYNKDRFDRVVVLSGDGDFLLVLKHLRDKEEKEVFVLARGTKTAREIKRFAGNRFIDVVNLRDCIERS